MTLESQDSYKSILQTIKEDIEIHEALSRMFPEDLIEFSILYCEDYNN